MPSKIAGGTPHIPLLGTFRAGLVVVMFTDIVGGSDGGSSGSDPCNDGTMSNAAVIVPMVGPWVVGLSVLSTLIGTCMASPQVFLFSDIGEGTLSISWSESEISGGGAWYVDILVGVVGVVFDVGSWYKG